METFRVIFKIILGQALSQENEFEITLVSQKTKVELIEKILNFKKFLILQVDRILYIFSKNL